MSRILLLAFLASVVLPQVHAQSLAKENPEEARVRDLADEFESARVNADYAKAKVLVSPHAKATLRDGRVAPLLAGIQNLSARKKTQGPSEPVRVVEREVTILDQVAIVNELLGATRDVPTEKKVVPQSRTTTWMKGTDGWRVVSMHTSDYGRWEKSISAFEVAEQATPSADGGSGSSRTPAGGIVFVGSSSIRGWKTLKEDFPGLHVIGRGFGGSQLIDSVLYSHRIITKYKPRAVAVYAGDNDVAAGKSSERVFSDFKELVATIHAVDPKIRIGFIAIKPSLKRWDMWPTMLSANQMVAEFAANDERITFLDISKPMLGADGKPIPAMFVKDGLHMTGAGYEAWTKVVMPWAKGE